MFSHNRSSLRSLLSQRLANLFCKGPGLVQEPWFADPCSEPMQLLTLPPKHLDMELGGDGREGVTLPTEAERQRYGFGLCSSC